MSLDTIFRKSSGYSTYLDVGRLLTDWGGITFFYCRMDISKSHSRSHSIFFLEREIL